MSEYIEKTIDGIRVYKLSHSGNWTIVDSQKALDKLKSQQQQINHLTAENEALQARVGVLNDALNYATALAETGQVPRKEVHQKWRAMYDESPPQSLSHIRSEAVREAAQVLPKNFISKGREYWTIDVDVLSEYANQLEQNG